MLFRVGSDPAAVRLGVTQFPWTEWGGRRQQSALFGCVLRVGYPRQYRLNRSEQEDLMNTASYAAFLGVALATVAPAGAHVSLDTAQAPALGYVRLAVRVPHG